MQFWRAESDKKTRVDMTYKSFPCSNESEGCEHQIEIMFLKELTYRQPKYLYCASCKKHGPPAERDSPWLGKNHKMPKSIGGLDFHGKTIEASMDQDIDTSTSKTVACDAYLTPMFGGRAYCGAWGEYDVK